MNYGEAVEEFEEFFQGEYKDEIKNFSDNRKEDLAVSFQKIDLFNPYLADYLRENGENGIGAAEEGLQASDKIDEDVPIWFNDFPEERQILPAEVSPDHVEGYVAMRIKVENATQPQPIVVSAIFECIQCGDRYEKAQEKVKKLKTPHKCDCGSRKFEVHKKIRSDYQQITPLTGYKDLDIEVQGDARNPHELEEHEIVLYGVLGVRDEEKTKTGYFMKGQKVEIID